MFNFNIDFPEAQVLNEIAVENFYKCANEEMNGIITKLASTLIDMAKDAKFKYREYFYKPDLEYISFNEFEIKEIVDFLTSKGYYVRVNTCENSAYLGSDEIEFEITWGDANNASD